MIISILDAEVLNITKLGSLNRLMMSLRGLSRPWQPNTPLPANFMLPLSTHYIMTSDVSDEYLKTVKYLLIFFSITPCAMDDV
jgi:hypothetical protein